jgi:TatA/E family protein of Tat protein translocase
MFGSLGATEILVLAVIGLLVFGPRRLPEMGRNLGRTLYEFRKAAMDLRTSVEREINLEELKQAGQAFRLDPPPVAATPARPASQAARETQQGDVTGAVPPHPERAGEPPSSPAPSEGGPGTGNVVPKS